MASTVVTRVHPLVLLGVSVRPATIAARRKIPSSHHHRSRCCRFHCGCCYRCYSMENRSSSRTQLSSHQRQQRRHDRNMALYYCDGGTTTSLFVCIDLMLPIPRPVRFDQMTDFLKPTKQLLLFIGLVLATFLKSRKQL